MQRGNKKRFHYDKNDFSDQEIYQEIRQNIRDIKQSNKLNEVQKIQKIDNLYREHKQSKKLRKMIEKGNDQRAYTYNQKKHNDSESDQPGEINQQQQQVHRAGYDRNSHMQTKQTDISTVQLGELIRNITLTRKRLIDFLDNRKFEDLVKGCFVRYKSDSSTDKQAYVIAQIIGVKQGVKQYSLTATHKTKILLSVQESTYKVVDLPIEMVSNQTITGNIQIMKWAGMNRQKVLKERDLRQKLEQHTRLLTEQLSSQQIDKNIQNRAIAIAKSDQEVRSFEEIQNLIDFIVEKIENFQTLEQEQIFKRKDDKLQLIQIRRKKLEFQQVRHKLQQRRKQWIQKNKGIKQAASDKLSNQQDAKAKQKLQKVLGQNLKRQDAIKEKCRLREMLLSTAQGYERIKINMMQNHMKYDIQIDI